MIWIEKTFCQERHCLGFNMKKCFLLIFFVNFRVIWIERNMTDKSFHCSIFSGFTQSEYLSEGRDHWSGMTNSTRALARVSTHCVQQFARLKEQMTICSQEIKTFLCLING